MILYSFVVALAGLSVTSGAPSVNGAWPAPPIPTLAPAPRAKNAPAHPAGTPLRVTAEPFSRIDRDGMQVGCFNVRSGYTLRSEDAAFGGVSAIRLDSGSALLLTDAATLFRLPMFWADRPEGRARDGRVAVAGARFALRSSDGAVLDKDAADTEGLVIADDHLLISVERTHRIARFAPGTDGFTDSATALAIADDAMPSNAGLEALARRADGAVIAIAEGTRANGLARAYFRSAGDEDWSDMGYRPKPPYRVTDAAFDPASGDLIVLERAFSRWRGPSARLARVAARQIEPGTDLSGREIARLNALHGVDNMEGIDVWRDSAGALHVVLIADDNFNDHQRTILLAGTLDETPPCSAPQATAGQSRN